MSDFKLPTGQYYIRNQETFAGRSLIEDKSAFPKRVNCPTNAGQELWDVERLDNGRYKLKDRGAPTGEINKLLFALLIDADKAEEWIITKRKDDGHRSQYTIEKADKSAGWVKQTGQDENDPQIAVRPLIILPSDPPVFIPSELWNIQPLVN